MYASDQHNGTGNNGPVCDQLLALTIAHAAINSQFFSLRCRPHDETKPLTGWHVANIPAGGQSPIPIRGMPSIENRVRLPLDGGKTIIPSINPADG
jgi:hypothetical protein